MLQITVLLKHIFFAYQESESSVNILRRIRQTSQFCDVMRLVVSKDAKDLLTQGIIVFGRRQADITLSTVMGCSLSKISQKLARTALVVTLGIMEHGMNALTILCETVFIHITMQLDMLCIFTSLYVSDVRHIATRNEMEQMALGECFQYIVGLRLGKSGLLSYDALVDVAIVGKKPPIIT